MSYPPSDASVPGAGSYSPESPPYAPAYQPDFFRFLEDSTEELRLFRLYLEGLEEYEDSESGERKTRRAKNTEPMLNEAGVHFIMTSLIPVCTKNTFVSNLKEERMYEISLATSQSITIGLFKGMIGKNAYGVRRENFDLIVEACNNLVEMSFRRPIGQGEREVIRNNRTEHVSRMIDAGQQGRGGQGFWNMFKG